jgi:hypothetical protein
MALEVRIRDSMDDSRNVLFFSIHVDQMDEPMFLRMSEMLLEEFEWPLRRDRTEIRAKETFQRLLALFSGCVEHHTAEIMVIMEAYYTIAAMMIPGLILTRVVNGNLVRVHPYVEGATRLHELFPEKN